MDSVNRDGLPRRDSFPSSAWERLNQRLAEAPRPIADPRDQDNLKHSTAELLAQKVDDILRGSEDDNDAKLLPNDPLMKTLVGRSPDDDDLARTSPNMLCAMRASDCVWKLGFGVFGDHRGEAVNYSSRDRQGVGIQRLDVRSVAPSL